METVLNTGSQSTASWRALAPPEPDRSPAFLSLPVPRPQLPRRSLPPLTATSLFSSATAATPAPGSAGSGLQARRFLAGLGEKKEYRVFWPIIPEPSKERTRAVQEPTRLALGEVV